MTARFTPTSPRSGRGRAPHRRPRRGTRLLGGGAADRADLALHLRELRRDGRRLSRRDHPADLQPRAEPDGADVRGDAGRARRRRGRARLRERHGGDLGRRPLLRRSRRPHRRGAQRLSRRLPPLRHLPAAHGRDASTMSTAATSRRSRRRCPAHGSSIWRARRAGRSRRSTSRRWPPSPARTASSR